MTILIPTSNKPKIIALLRELCRETMYPHLSPGDQQVVEGQCAWMASSDSGPVTLRAEMGSEPMSSTVSFKFDLIFTPAPLGKGQ